VDVLQRSQIEQRRAAIAALLAQDATLGQREIAKRVGSSQKTVSRDIEAMRSEADSASHAAAQRDSGLLSAGQQYRQRMDTGLARLAGVMGADLVWSVAELETLAAVSAAMDRRAAMLRAWSACEDPLAQRALDAARELRLVERQITSITNAIQDGLSKLLRDWEAEQARQAEEQKPESVRSRKARKAVNTRWKRERLVQEASERLAQRQASEASHA
jgi:transposase